MTGRSLVRCIQITDYFRIKGLPKLTERQLREGIEFFVGSDERTFKTYVETMLRNNLIKAEGEYFIINFGVADEIATLTHS